MNQVTQNTFSLWDFIWYSKESI